MEELLVTKQPDPFCIEILRELNEGVVLVFCFNKDGILIQKVELCLQLVISHTPTVRVLHRNR